MLRKLSARNSNVIDFISDCFYNFWIGIFIFASANLKDNCIRVDTNIYKLGIDSISIMKITGPRQHTTFMKNIRVDKEENAVRMSDHSFFNKKTYLKIFRFNTCLSKHHFMATKVTYY